MNVLRLQREHNLQTLGCKSAFSDDYTATETPDILRYVFERPVSKDWDVKKHFHKMKEKFSLKIQRTSSLLCSIGKNNQMSDLN